MVLFGLYCKIKAIITIWIEDIKIKFSALIDITKPEFVFVNVGITYEINSELKKIMNKDHKNVKAAICAIQMKKSVIKVMSFLL